MSAHRVLVCLLLAAGLVFRLAADSSPTSYTIQTVAGTDNSGNGGSALAIALGQPEGIAMDSAGNIYVAEAANSRVRKISTGGSIQTIAGTGVAGFSGDGGPATAAQLNQPYGLAIDSSGVLYIADLGNARVRKVTTDGNIRTVAGGGTLPAATTGQGGAATSAQLAQPRNVAISADDSLYISDFGANQIYRVTTDGTLSLFAGSGTAGFSGVGTSALMAELNAPAGLAVDQSGAVYVADSGNNRIRKIYSGEIITVFNTTGPTGVALDASGMVYIAATNYVGSLLQGAAGASSARDLTLDAKGNIYATSGAYVVEVSASGNVTTIAGSGNSPNYSGDGGQATAARLNSPSGVVVDSSGDWYIADTANHRMRMVTPEGVITTIAGTGTAGSSGDNGAATKAELSSPQGLAIDGSHNLYVADTGNNAVRKITPGGVISTVASKLNNPLAVAVDSQSNLYIADNGGNQIVQVNVAGTAGTFAKIIGPLAVAVDASGNVVASNATQVWSIAANGTPISLAKGLTSPAGLIFATDGTLLIADTGGNVIRSLTASGALTAIAGTGTAGFSGDGGPALSSQLNAPAAVGLGSNGSILIADSANNRIRSLTPATASAETTASVSIVNAASLASGGLAAGEIITIFGTGFDPANTQLLFDGKPSTLFYTSATQINALAPAGLSNASTNVSVVVDGSTAATATVPIVAAAPGIFTVANGTGQAAANNQDGSINSSSNPAARGAVVSIYATGEGSATSANVTLTIAGYTAPILYAGPAPGFPGLMQINAQIPAGFLPPGIQDVVLTVGNASSQSGVTLAIK